MGLADLVHEIVQNIGCHQKAQHGFLQGIAKLRLAKAAAEGLIHTFFIARIVSIVIFRNFAAVGPSAAAMPNAHVLLPLRPPRDSTLPGWA